MEVVVILLCIVVAIAFGLIYSLYKSRLEKQDSISRLSSEKSSLESKLKTANEMTVKLQKSMQSTEGLLNNALFQNKAADTKINSLTERLSAASKENDSLTERLSAASKENDSLTERLSAVSKENDSLTERLSAVQYSNSLIHEKICELEQQKILSEKKLIEAQLSYLKMAQSIQEEFDTSIGNHSEKFTYVASLMADYLTLGIKKAEEDLETSDKYHERQRAKKVAEIRDETKTILTKYKEAQYQLDYLLTMYPELNDVVNNSSIDLSFQDMNTNYEVFNDDPISGYITRSEWDNLSTTERNQLAFERYLSRPKSNWEIGRDYELYIAHLFELDGYSVDTFGSYMRINDLGRDLIARKGDKIKVIQCKYWSSQKEIHENHICQLYGTVICYCIEHSLALQDVDAVFVTSTTLSKKAREFAKMLKIQVRENMPLKEFPRIKCNIGYDEWGKTRIYHLPMDDLYDKVKISKQDECYCYSVYEAENLGFRRAYKWHGN